MEIMKASEKKFSGAFLMNKAHTVQERDILSGGEMHIQPVRDNVQELRSSFVLLENTVMPGHGCPGKMQLSPDGELHR